MWASFGQAALTYRPVLSPGHAPPTRSSTASTSTEPIKNPVSGEEHRIQVSIPEGFEYKLAEIGNAVVNGSTGTLAYDWPNSHSSLAEIEHTHTGVIQAT